jgi:hypothetical protein
VKRKVSFIRIDKSPFSRWRKNSKLNTSSGSHRKNQTRKDRTNKKSKYTHPYEQKCQSHTCSGTIVNNSMDDSALTTTTSPWTSSAPYSGSRPMTSTNLWTEFLLQFQQQWEDSAILLASNRPQQQGQDKKRLTQREKKTRGKDNREKLWTSGLARSSPLTRPETKSFCKQRNFQKGIFL